MKSLRVLLLLLTFTFTARVTLAAPELPNPKFLPELVDGVGKWYLNFETLPGYHYIVEESQDLENWTPAPSGSFYGNGNSQRLYVCDGPMWADTPSSGGGQIQGQGMWQLRNLYMKLEMQSGNNGLVQRLSRASYTPIGETEPLPAWDKALTLTLPAQTARFRYFPMLEWDDVATHTMYWVGLQVVITDNPAPSESFVTTADEAEELNVFSHLEAQLIGQLLAEEGPPQPPESHPHKFARVRRSEIDVNGNGLWDWWEILYNFDPFALPGQPGYCDPNADGDGDGVSNAQEQAQGSNPNLYDTDHDGFHDGEDTDPRDPKKHPPPVTYLLIAKKRLYFFNIGSGEYYVQYKYKDWMLFDIPEFSVISRYTTPKLMEDAFSLPLLPTNEEGLPLKGDEIDLSTALQTIGEFTSHKAEVAPDVDSSEGNLAHTRCWLVHKPIETSSTKAQFIRVDKQFANDAALVPPTTPQILTMEVLGGRTLSEPIDLKPVVSGVPITGDSYEARATVSLHPIVLVSAQDKSLTNPKVATLSAAGVLPNSSPVDLTQEPDRIYVQISGAADYLTGSVKIQTTGNPDSDYNDLETELTLLPNSGSLRSRPLILVSDKVDDELPIEGVGDDAKNDQSHKIQLGGKVKLTDLKLGEDFIFNVNAQFSAKIEKTVKLKFVNCQYGLVLPEDCWSNFAEQRKIMAERFAQAGVKLEWALDTGPNIGISGWLTDGEFPLLVGSGPMVIPEKTKSIFNANPAGDPEEIVVYLVRRIGSGNGSDEYAGISTMEKYISAADKIAGYSNKIIAGQAQMFTLPHELLHILLDAKHDDYATEFANSKMLWHSPTSETNTFTGTKRISPEQIIKIKQSKLAK